MNYISRKNGLSQQSKKGELEKSGTAQEFEREKIGTTTDAIAFFFLTIIQSARHLLHRNPHTP